MPYPRFWESLCRAHRATGTRGCPCCEKGISPGGASQCPECALVFRGRGWEGLEAHWQAKHGDVMAYDDLWRALCPAHRGMGDGRSGFLPFSDR